MEIKGIEIPKIPRARFDWSKKHIGTYKKGPIYPVWSKIMPGNTSMELRASAVARQLSTLAPSFEEARIIMRAFTVPLRILWEDYKNWKVGFKEYSDEVPFNGDVPRWTPAEAKDTNPKSLWTALGFPCNTLPDIMPADFKAQAYAFIYDTNMRYRPVEDSVLIDGEPGTWDHKKGADENGFFQILRDRDYFTTGLTKQQIGEAVALPITGETAAYWDEILPIYNNPHNAQEITGHGSDGFNSIGLQGQWQKAQTGDFSTFNPVVHNRKDDQRTYGLITEKVNSQDGYAKVVQRPTIFNDPGVIEAFNNNTVSMNNIASVTISMLRLAASRQKELELLARTGVFYPDVIRLNTGTAPSNEILGLPVYRGGFTIRMVNSEVLQTSQSTDNSSLGDMAGHSLGAGYGDAINVHVNEDSVFLLLMYIKSETFYGAQQFRKEDEFMSNLDFPHPQYQHVSEQPVKKREICCASTKFLEIDDNGNRSWSATDLTTEATEYNNETFMFQPNYESWTSEYNTVSGLMIMEQFIKAGSTDISFNYNLYNWTPARFFTNVQGFRPAFNLEFLQFKEDPRNQAVQYVDNKGKIIEDNYIIWIRLDTDVYLTLDKYRAPGGITL